MRSKLVAIDEESPSNSEPKAPDADVADDVEQFTKGAASISAIISNGLLAVGSMAGALVTAPLYSLGYLTGAAAIGFTLKPVMKYISEKDNEQKALREDWQRAVREALDGRADVDLGNSVEPFVKELSERLDAVAQATLKGRLAKFLLNNLPFLAGDAWGFPLAYGIAAAAVTAQGTGSLLHALPQITLAVYSGQRATGALTKAMRETSELPAAKNAIDRLLRPLLRENANDDVADAVDINPSRQLGGVALALERPVATLPGGAFTLDMETAPRISIARGSRLYVVGENGTGKSTLFNTIVRRVSLDAGDIKVFGTSIREATRSSLRDVIGVLRQKPAMFAGTVEHNIRFFRSEQELSQQELQDIFDSLQFPPEITLQTKVKERDQVLVSGGIEARIALGRVIAGKPKILLLDEPTAPLDPKSKNVVNDLLDALQDQGMTIVQIGQSMVEIEQRSQRNRKNATQPYDRILVLNGGEVEQFGTHGSLAYQDDGTYAQLLKAEKNGGREDSKHVDQYDPPRPFHIPRQVVRSPKSLGSPALDHREAIKDAAREMFEMGEFTHALAGLGLTDRQLEKCHADPYLRRFIGQTALEVFDDGRPAAECVADLAGRVHAQLQPRGADLTSLAG
jgi:ABC-type multidrug transport system fused ATPase/permease subunit